MYNRVENSEKICYEDNTVTQPENFIFKILTVCNKNATNDRTSDAGAIFVRKK